MYNGYQIAGLKQTASSVDFPIILSRHPVMYKRNPSSPVFGSRIPTGANSLPKVYMGTERRGNGRTSIKTIATRQRRDFNGPQA